MGISFSFLVSEVHPVAGVGHDDLHLPAAGESPVHLRQGHQDPVRNVHECVHPSPRVSQLCLQTTPVWTALQGDVLPAPHSRSRSGHMS